MSTWTHLGGLIRIDGIPGITPFSDEESLSQVLGNTVNFEDEKWVWDKCNVPCGSEGSLQYKIIRSGDGLILWTVAVWGDLRDFDNIQGIEDWFDKVTKKSKLLIRSAILQIEVENGENKVLQYTEKRR